MANICSFSMMVKGKKENIEEFYNALTQNGDIWMGRGAECEIQYEDEENTAFIDGWCKWSLISALVNNAISMRTEPEQWSFGKFGKDKPKEFITLIEASEKWHLGIDVYSEEPGCSFQEHIVVKNGDVEVNECVEYYEYYLDEYDSKEEAEKYLMVKISDEQWEEKLYSSGGYDEWKFDLSDYDPYSLDNEPKKETESIQKIESAKDLTEKFVKLAYEGSIDDIFNWFEINIGEDSLNHEQLEKYQNIYAEKVSYKRSTLENKVVDIKSEERNDMTLNDENVRTLAVRINELSKDVDQYGYNDEVDDPEAFVETLVDQIKNGDVDSIVAWFDECELSEDQQKEFDDIKRELNELKNRPLEHTIKECSEMVGKNNMDKAAKTAKEDVERE